MQVIHHIHAEQINILDERFYLNKKTGEYYPSVTTVLDVYPKGAGYIQWLKDLGNNSDEVVRRAAEQGSKIHDAIDKYLTRQEVRWMDDEGKTIYTLEEWKMILRFVDFWTTFKPHIKVNEFMAISENYKLGGTIDIVCELNGELWLIDAKSSNAIHPSHELQLAAYATMWNEQFPKAKIQRAGILWLKATTRGADKKGEKIQGASWQLKEFDRHYTDAFKIFQHTRAIWNEENPNYKPKNLIYPDRIKLTNEPILTVNENGSNS